MRILRRSPATADISRPVARAAACAAACATAAAVLAACTSGGGAGSNGSNAAAAPAVAIKTAAARAHSATSLSGTISAKEGGSDPATLTGTFKIQLKPSLLLGEDLSVDTSGQKSSVKLVLTSSAIYVQTPGLSMTPGKPWVKVGFSQLSGTVAEGFSELIADAESANPLMQAEAITASANARKLGTQVINGVTTTHYQGTLSAAQALAALPSALRSAGKTAMSGTVTWNAWLDAQDNLRQLTESETVQGSPATVTADITSINGPVTVTVPPASQVGPLPSIMTGGK